MKRFNRFIAMSLVLVLVISLGAFSAAAQDEVVMVIGWEQEPSTLNPISTMAFSSYLDNFYRRDVWDWRGNNAEIYPIMVEEIPTVENGMVVDTEDGGMAVTYKLREGMLWSDGTPITTADCALGHRLYSDVTTGDFQRGVYPEVVDRLDVIDDHTAVLVYNEPFPDYLVDFPLTCSYPAHLFDPILDAEGNINNAPFLFPNGVADRVSYGPYVFESWDIGQQITFVRNPNWGVNDFETVPAIDVIVTRFITETAQMRSALEVGDIDMAFNFPLDIVESYQEIPDIEVWNTPGVFQDAIWINMYEDGNQHPALKDIRVRQAIVHALDRQEMINTLLDPGMTIPPNYFHINWVPGDVQPMPYDPDLANELLDEAGWTDTNGDGVRDDGAGNSLTLRFFTTTAQLRMDFQLLVQQYLDAVGIRTQLLPVPATILFASFTDRGILRTGDFDLALFALSYDPLSPNIPIDWFGCDYIQVQGGNNSTGFCDPEFDALALTIATTVDPDDRADAYHEAARRLSEAVTWVGLFPRDTFYAVNSTRFDPASMREMGVLTGNYFNQVEHWQPAN